MRRGFTLIELLVVIAIIAILAAILFPVFARAREKARQTSCLSNVKQLVLGCHMYAQDYDEILPSSRVSMVAASPCGSNKVIPWMMGIAPYVKNKQLFTCPSGPDPAGPNPCLATVYNNDFTPTNYGINASPICWDNVGGVGIKMANIPTPAGAFYVMEPGNTQAGNATRANGTGGGCGCTFSRDSFTIHNGGVNVGFADGHAKWLGADKVWAPDYNTWSNNGPWRMGLAAP